MITRIPAVSWLIGALMVAAGIGANFAKPSVRVADERAISLEKMIPTAFGEWQEEPQRSVQVVNPQTQEIIDRVYSQVLSRVYVSKDGYRIMLSLAYGSDQRGALQAHKPEVCYPAQGFTLEKNEVGQLATPFGEIPVRRLYTTLRARQEPVTYWFTVGDRAVMGKLEKRLVEIRLGLTGRIPDGMLFRVSSIDGNRARAYQYHQQFVVQLLQAVPPADRERLSGLTAL